MIRLLNKKSNSILIAGIVIGVGGILSRVLGLVRDRIFAYQFGAGIELDIYYAAFRIPDFIYAVLIMGAVSAAFIPVFSGLLKNNVLFEEDKIKENSEAHKLGVGILNIFTFGVGIISLILFIFAPLLVRIIAPGFSDGEMINLTILLTRVMLIQPILLSASTIITGMLHSFNRFIITSLSPVMYNLGIIIGAVFFTPVFGVFGLAYGVILGALLHFAIQIPALIEIGFKWRPWFNFNLKNTKLVFKLMLPRAFGIMGHQINFIVITAIASTLAIGSIAIFNFANNIQYVPVSLIGITLATAAFPTLSKKFSNEHKQEFLITFTTVFKNILFLGLPLSILFIILRAQIVRVILGTGRFDWQDTQLTAAALGIFGISVFAQTLIPIITKAFYSSKNTKTPAFITLGAVILNIVLSFYFVEILSKHGAFYQYIVERLHLIGVSGAEILGLPIAFSISAIIQFLILIFIFVQHFDKETLNALSKSWLKILASSAVLGITTYYALRPLSQILDMKTGLGIFLQGIGAGIAGILVYLITSYLLKSEELKNILSKIKFLSTKKTL